MNKVHVKAAFPFNARVAQDGLGVGLLQHDGSGIDGMVVGFGHPAAGSGVKVAERRGDHNEFHIVARADVNGLRILPAARG